VSAVRRPANYVLYSSCQLSPRVAEERSWYPFAAFLSKRSVALTMSHADLAPQLFVRTVVDKPPAIGGRGV